MLPILGTLEEVFGTYLEKRVYEAKIAAIRSSSGGFVDKNKFERLECLLVNGIIA